MEEIKLLILGIIQGLTEFFPISSSGHIKIYNAILNVSDPREFMMLAIVVHFATALSTMVVYKDKINHILKSLLFHRSKKSALFILKLIVSAMPIILVYYFLEPIIDRVFQDATILVCVMFIFTGCVLILSSLKTKTNKDINFLHAFLMGVVQAVAIVPGISRSGSTISIALFCNIDKEKAAEFSFLMALAPIIGGVIVELLQPKTTINEVNYIGYIIAFFAAFFAGLFACKYMIKIVQNNNLKYFGYYCIVLGISCLVYFLL